jgi:hypothetical protein
MKPEKFLDGFWDDFQKNYKFKVENYSIPFPRSGEGGRHLVWF